MQIESRKDEPGFRGLASRGNAAQVEIKLARRRRMPLRNENFLNMIKMKKISTGIKESRRGNIGKNFFEEKYGKVKKSHIKEILPKVRPMTPHNTSQYLINNFTKSRKDNVFNLISKYTNYLEPDIEDMIKEDLMTTEDLCVSGGSMMEIISNRGGPMEIQDLQENYDNAPEQLDQQDQIDEKTNFTNLTPKEMSRFSRDYSENEEESTVDENNFYFSVKSCKNENEYQYETERGINLNDDQRDEKINSNFYNEERKWSEQTPGSYLEQISNQHKEIQILLLELRSVRIKETVNGINECNGMESNG
jgi:hypothetical protein